MRKTELTFNELKERTRTTQCYCAGGGFCENEGQSSRCYWLNEIGLMFRDDEPEAWSAELFLLDLLADRSLESRFIGYRHLTEGGRRVSRVTAIALETFKADPVNTDVIRKFDDQVAMRTFERGGLNTSEAEKRLCDMLTREDLRDRRAAYELLLDYQDRLGRDTHLIFAVFQLDPANDEIVQDVDADIAAGPKPR